MANLYTKTGDKGTTALVGGSRVSKASLKVDAYGTVDEAISYLGLARANSDDDFIASRLEHIEVRLFSVGGELSADEKGKAKLAAIDHESDDTNEMTFSLVTEKDVAYLEQIADECTEIVGKQRGFVVPGVDVVSSQLHVARTIVRRAERMAIALSESEPVRPEALKFLNRLSDAVYALARYAEEAALTKERDQLCDMVIKAVKERLNMSNDTYGTFDLDTLRAMALRAEERAKQINVPCVFAAVDAGGNLVLLQRMEDSLLCSLKIAQAKAYSALATKMTTEELGKAAQPGAELFAIDSSDPGRFVLFGGGFPFVVDGKVVGGIGVSGGTVEQDMDIARYAMAL